MSKVSYKVSDDPRLKNVDFHGRTVRPLYIKLTHARHSTTFKSAYFDQLIKPKHKLHIGAISKIPTQQQILAKEKQTIDFIIEKLGSTFNYELFKKQYDYYTTDLCDLTEKEYNEFLMIYFSDEGMPAFARSLYEGNKSEAIFQVIDDLKICVTSASYEKLLDASYSMAPPYLVLYSFTRSLKKWPVTLSIAEWENKPIQQLFMEHLKKNFLKLEPVRVLEQVNSYVEGVYRKT
ncbi:hypothetical protein PV783_24505 [Chitinophaga sp. CC14]|uniref:hypothetical protein n=1 Tax=Chitinophaga sp. CC14 TaxID=3029199 RepID=UPI003B7F1667